MATEYKIGEADTRPWGRWQVVDAGDNFVVKRINVKQGGILSLQKHQHRDEHWIITNGTAEVQVGENIKTYQAGSHIFIQAGEIHRISNPSEQELIFIEVQQGSILDENDIERLEDKYGR